MRLDEAGNGGIYALHHFLFDSSFFRNGHFLVHVPEKKTDLLLLLALMHNSSAPFAFKMCFACEECGRRVFWAVMFRVRPLALKDE